MQPSRQRKYRKIALAAVVIAAAAILFVATKPRAPKPLPVAVVAPTPAQAPAAPRADTAPLAISPAPTKTHGPKDVVRSRSGDAAVTTQKHARFAPRWDAPVELSFRRLKELRRDYLVTSTFQDSVIRALSGRAAAIHGAIMPVDPVPESGALERFWIANPVVVMAGCVFCVPPTLADLVYTTTGGRPLVVDREQLYRSIVLGTFLGRFEIGPVKTPDGVTYMFGMELKKRLD